MGLGAYEDGSGISAVRFLLSQGAKVTVTDLKTKDQLADQIKRLGKLTKKIKFVLGEHREIDFKSVDLIVRNPGVPKSSKYLKVAQDHNIPIETDISIFFQLVDRKRIIGVTGTRGKSTTTTLLYEFIKTRDKSAVLGGNITKSPLAQMPQVKKGGEIVLELSSWLLESMGTIKRSPHIAVFTNIYPDHLNTYKDIHEYASAKKNIFAWQNLQDYAILSRDNKFTRAMGSDVPSQRFWTSLKRFPIENGCFVSGGKIIFRRDGKEQIICSVKDIRIPGEHNVANILNAVCAAVIYGIKPQAIRSVLKKFKGIPNRLEFLKEIRGVKYFNDTTSTTPEATIAGLEAIGKKRNIILIAGGSDKGLDFRQLAREIKKTCKALVLLNDSGTERLEKEIGNWKPASPAGRLEIGNYAKVNSMADAVGIANSFAKRGDVILLSPACASFGLFINEFDRGDQFRKFVNRMK